MKTIFILFSVFFAIGAYAGVEQIVRLAEPEEPPTLNSMKAADTVSAFILGHISEGLTRLDSAGKIVAGVAEKWEIGDKSATFHLRKNAKWSDGKPVTAKDFVFAWQNALDPKTASDYAFILYYLKNGEAINKGKVPPSDLGVVAKDDYTLFVNFEKPCAYFASLASFQTYAPVREDFFKQHGEKYAAEANTLLYNGPFMLTSWVHGASLKMVKNPN